MPFFIRENLNFRYLDRGSGVPVVFQHGLGGDAEKIFGLIDLPAGFRLLGLDCRAHGKTTPIGPIEKIEFGCLADDVIAMLDHLELNCAVCGGTSMGAGVTLNLALRYPKRVKGLVLLRPAWLDGPNPANVRLFDSIAELLREHGPIQGREVFAGSELYAHLRQESADSAESILALFEDPRATETLARLERIPKGAPNWDRTQWRQIDVPTLVLGTQRDPIHPFEYAKIIAREIPNAEFEELTPKSVNFARYASELNSCLGAFLRKNFTC